MIILLNLIFDYKRDIKLCLRVINIQLYKQTGIYNIQFLSIIIVIIKLLIYKKKIVDIRYTFVDLFFLFKRLLSMQMPKQNNMHDLKVCRDVV